MLQLKQLGPSSSLYGCGLRWVVSDKETLEILAAFLFEEDAATFLKGKDATHPKEGQREHPVDAPSDPSPGPDPGPG